MSVLFAICCTLVLSMIYLVLWRSHVFYMMMVLTPSDFAEFARQTPCHGEPQATLRSLLSGRLVFI